MMSSSSSPGTDLGLRRFFTIPRETIRASLSILENITSREGRIGIDQKLVEFGRNILEDRAYQWPLPVQAESDLSLKLHKLYFLTIAQLIQFDCESRLGNQGLAKYVVPFPQFFTHSVHVDGRGYLEEGDTLNIRHLVNATRSRRLKRMVYQDYILDSPECDESFEKFIAAAEFKSEFYAHDHIRQTCQPVLPKIPHYLKNVLFVNEFRQDKTLSEHSRGDEIYVDKEHGSPMRRWSINDSEVSEPILTPPDTRGSSPFAGHMTAESDISTEQLKVSYIAVFETRNEKVNMMIDTNDTPGKQVDAVREIWSWLANKGYGNVRLQDVVELAQKMAAK
ncbi:hypothetical protein P153DRAFT_112104 [Dothidotthia symphoricarpi CBS 119687]|uniref:Uncharacterized protein n=1 Tax=Dothidotthia symphoricarpi CBS 119687 TaxID=1392245 RepID=A0A6A6A464_9PLEO|nr:uncharacterized protein P153DRAFT_112104 [Dothidotthia symphoricarpi CBS 119687]KAF2125381.1 hypothetical protein P153DRAFT_112104 [Dothidotthia symphoricarpi CBS 119687]